MQRSAAGGNVQRVLMVPVNRKRLDVSALLAPKRQQMKRRSEERRAQAKQRTAEAALQTRPTSPAVASCSASSSGECEGSTDA